MQYEVLVVNHDQEIAKGFADLIKIACGFVVTSTIKPLEALQVFVDDPSKFGIVVVAHMMPQLTGYELIQEFAKYNSTFDIVFVYTRDDAPLGEMEARFVERFHSVRLPYDSEHFVQVLDQIVAKRLTTTGPDSF